MCHETNDKHARVLTPQSKFRNRSRSRRMLTAFQSSGAGRLHHGGNPIMGWMASNCAVRQDQNDNIVPTKKQSTGRIDGIVASIIGLSRAMLSERESYYEKNRLFVL